MLFASNPVRAAYGCPSRYALVEPSKPYDLHTFQACSLLRASCPTPSGSAIAALNCSRQFSRPLGHLTVVLSTAGHLTIGLLLKPGPRINSTISLAKLLIQALFCSFKSGVTLAYRLVEFKLVAYCLMRRLFTESEVTGVVALYTLMSRPPRRTKFIPTRSSVGWHLSIMSRNIRSAHSS